MFSTNERLLLESANLAKSSGSLSKPPLGPVIPPHGEYEDIAPLHPLIVLSGNLPKYRSICKKCLVSLIYEEISGTKRFIYMGVQKLFSVQVPHSEITGLPGQPFLRIFGSK